MSVTPTTYRFTCYMDASGKMNTRPLLDSQRSVTIDSPNFVHGCYVNKESYPSTEQCRDGTMPRTG